MTSPPAVAVLEETLEPALPLDEDLRPLRERFAGLMDKMLRELNTLRLDSDDCVLERQAVIRLGSGVETALPVESLTDRDWFLKCFADKHLAFATERAATKPVWVTAISLHAIRVPDYPAGKPHSE